MTNRKAGVFSVTENSAKHFPKLLAEVTAHAEFVRTARAELTLYWDIESNKTVQVDLAYEATKSVLRKNNNYQRVKNGLIQRLFNLWQVWQTLIEPYSNSVCRLPQPGVPSKCGWMWYLRIFIRKENGRCIYLNHLYISNLMVKWRHAIKFL